MRRFSELVDRTGLIGEHVKGREKRIPGAARKVPRILVASVLAVVVAVVVLAVVLAPASQTGARAGRTGGNCDVCHPVSGTPFLTVTGFPTQYVPNQEYTITITIDDTNGLFVGENSFDLILSTGGGSVVGVDSTVSNVSALEVATEDSVNATTNQWTVKWTAPASGTVTVDTWAVWGTGAGMDSGYTRTTMNTDAIPEFSLVLLPVIGIGAAVVLISRVSKRKGGA